MTEPTTACLRCYGHAINVNEALAGDHVIATTGKVHKPSVAEPGKTECGRDIPDDWTVSAYAIPAESVVLTGGRRVRHKHRPPSGRRS